MRLRFGDIFNVVTLRKYIEKKIEVIIFQKAKFLKKIMN
jgi:hypothetical protein